MNFCLRCLGPPGDVDSQLTIRNNHRSTLDEYLDPSSGRSTPCRAAPSSPASERHPRVKGVASEILTCIQLLTASPNGPVQATSEKILHGLQSFVKSAPTASGALQPAFNAINTVVMKVLFDQSSLVRVSILDLVPVVRRLWFTKLPALKDELLVTIMLCMIFLSDAAEREPSEYLADLITNLTDRLHLEYTKRPEKEALQLDELMFCQHNLRQDARPIVGPRLGNPRSEHNWTVVWAIASLMQLTAKVTANLAAPRVADQSPSKRQRHTSPVDDIFRDAVSSSGMRRICALQMIPFLITGQADIGSKAALLERLIQGIVDDNAALSSWTMVAIARYVSASSHSTLCSLRIISLATCSDARAPPLQQNWQKVWNLTSRASTLHGTSRAACTLMNTILQLDLLEYSAFADAARSTFSSVNVNGPSAISDSSLCFWSTITRMSAQLNPASVMTASKQICSWLKEAWTIGILSCCPSEPE